jgi:pimeloyl-ACP methyl ester carboxylesterase
MPRVRIGRIELAYEEIGSGDPLLFVSATSADRLMWGGQVAHFMGRFRCVTFDNRDVGESTIVTEGYTPRDLAADTLGLMDALALPPAHVVGHSLGGAIAQELALAAPTRVRSLTLVDTWAKNDDYTRAVFRTWQRLRRHLDDREFLEALLLFGVGYRFLNAAGIEQLVEMFVAAPRPQPPEAFCRQVDADLAHDTTERLARIACPTLVVAGMDDAIFAPHHHRMLADAIAGARLVMLPEVGHSPLIENADEFNRTLADFLDAGK